MSPNLSHNPQTTPHNLHHFLLSLKPHGIVTAYFQMYRYVVLSPLLELLAQINALPSFVTNTEYDYYLILIISASADGGPRSRVCARETLCSAPH